MIERSGAEPDQDPYAYLGLMDPNLDLGAPKHTDPDRVESASFFRIRIVIQGIPNPDPADSSSKHIEDSDDKWFYSESTICSFDTVPVVPVP